MRIAGRGERGIQFRTHLLHLNRIPGNDALLRPEKLFTERRKLRRPPLLSDDELLADRLLPGFNLPPEVAVRDAGLLSRLL